MASLIGNLFSASHSFSEEELSHFNITFDALMKISRVFKPNVLYKMWSKRRKLESKTSFCWGYAVDPKESGCKGTFAMSNRSLHNLKDFHFELMLREASQMIETQLWKALVSFADKNNSL